MITLKLKFRLLMLSALVLTACQPQNNQTTQQQPPQPTQSNSQSTKNQRVYKVAGDIKYPPYTFSRNGDGVMEGMDVDILNAIAKDQNIQFQFDVVPYSVMIERWDKEGIEVLSGGIASDDISNQHLKQSNSYLNSKDCIFALNPTNLNNWTKNTIATIPEDLLMDELFKNKHVQSKEQFLAVDTPYLGLASVVQNKAQSTIGDCIAFNYIATDKTLKEYKFQSNILLDSHIEENSNLIFGVSDKEPELLEKINLGLKHLRENGELERIIKKWSQAE